MKILLIVILFFTSGIAIAQPFNNVLLLNGQADHVQIPNNFGNNFTNDITIEAWVKPCSVSGHRMIYTKFYCVSNNNQFYFTILDGKLRWAWDNTGCQDGANFYESGIVVQANVWQHVAVRHTPTGVTLFHNGLPVPGTLIQGSYGSMLTSSEPHRIGVYKTITGNWFGEYNGLIDEVRVWDYPVTDSEINNRFNNPLVGNEAGLAAYFNMDITGSGTGLTVPNISTNGLAGALDGTAMGSANTPLFLNPVGSLTNPLFGADTTLCIGASLLLDASGYTGDYLWQDGSTDTVYNVSQAGLYYVSITNNCEVFRDSIQVDYAPVPQVDLGADITLCQGETILLDASNVSGATGYVWQDSSLNSTFLVDQPGTYSVFVDVNGCQGYDEINIDYSILYLDLGPPDTVICENTVLSFNIAQPGATYLWQDGSVSSQYFTQDSGLYIAQVSNLVCEITDSIRVKINSIEAHFSYETFPQCGVSPVFYSDSSLVNFGFVESLKWTVDGKEILFGASPIQQVKTSKTQNIKLIATSNYGCTDETSAVVSVVVYETPIANFAISNNEPRPNEIVEFTNTSTNANSYQWQINDVKLSDSNSVQYTFSQPDLYKIQLAASNSLCADTVVNYIKVKPPLLYYIPNAFTPDNNSLNQLFSPVFVSGFDPYEFKFTIYNRWGEVLFISSNPTIGWDGKYANEVVQKGVYVWKVSFLDIDIRERITETGIVTVVY